MAPPREEIFSLPNLLSLFRVGSIPVLLLLLYLGGPAASWLAAVLFFVAGLTDLADGWLARRMKKVSLLGQYLDPAADKLLIASMLIALVDLDRAPAWIAIIIIGRELAVTAMRAVASSQGFAVPSDLWGKSKTMVQMVAVFLLMAHPVAGLEVRFWGWVALWVAVVITAWSGVGYFLRFHRRLRAGEEARRRPTP
jgi:CDP-diacylglycerol--glycerol-3-phosphate 3-phosphatidyltransferase